MGAIRSILGIAAASLLIGACKDGARNSPSVTEADAAPKGDIIAAGGGRYGGRDPLSKPDASEIAAPEPPTPRAAPPGPLSLGELVLPIPLDWMSQPASDPSHLARYLVGEGGTASGVEVTVIGPRAADVVDSEVGEWLREVPDGKGQVPTLSGSRPEKVKVAGTEVTVIDVTGSAASGKDPSKPPQRLFVAIIPTASGVYLLKAAGAAAAMSTMKPVLMKVLDDTDGPGESP